MRKIITILLVLITIFGFNISVLAEEIAIIKETEISKLKKSFTNDETFISAYNINDEFDDDIVLVVLKKAYSTDDKQYFPDDFGDVLCEKIEDLTSFSSEYIQQKNELIQDSYMASIDRSAQLIAAEEKIAEIDEKLKLVNVDEFRRILKIKLTVPGKENVLKAIKILEKLPFVLSAEPDMYETDCAVDANDTLFGSQWALEDISIPECWEITTGSNTVNVGIIDSGVSLTHPEFSGRVLDSSNQDMITKSSINDVTGHGTKVTGIIGAATNNSVGISGINQNINLIPLRAMNADSTTSFSGSIAAIEYAISNDIPILNYSRSFSSYSESFYTKLISYKGLFVCSASNNSVNIDSTGNASYPSCYNLDNVISVGAYDSSGNWRYNYGATSVDLAAPGYGVYTTTLDGYVRVNGTSFSAPHVTAVASLIMSLPGGSNFTAAQVKAFILNGTDTVASFAGKCVTGGKLNAYRAVRNAMERGKATTVAGDFDGDGLDEMASFYGKESQMSLIYWENLGNAFDIEAGKVVSSSSEFRVSAIAGQVAAGDLDGDGLDEIGALYDYGDHLSYWMFKRRSDGKFNAYIIGQTGSTSNGAIKNRVAAGDIDGDGIDEMLALYDYSGQMGLWFFRRNPNGSFTHNLVGKTIVLNAASIDNRITSGDFDGDGLDEFGILYDNTANYLEMYILERMPNGAFNYYKQGQTGAVTFGNIKGLVSAGDYDADGTDEMMCLYGYDQGTALPKIRIFIFERTSAGTFYHYNSELLGSFRTSNIAYSVTTGKFMNLNCRDNMAGIYRYSTSSKVWTFGYTASGSWYCNTIPPA